MLMMFVLGGCTSEPESPAKQDDNAPRNDSKDVSDETTPTIYLNDYRA